MPPCPAAIHRRLAVPRKKFGATRNARVTLGASEAGRELTTLIINFGRAALLKATTWQSDIRTADEMNKVWDARVPAGHAPARACIGALSQGPEKAIEIQVTAVRQLRRCGRWERPVQTAAPACG